MENELAFWITMVVAISSQIVIAIRIYQSAKYNLK